MMEWRHSGNQIWRTGLSVPEQLWGSVVSFVAFFHSPASDRHVMRTRVDEFSAQFQPSVHHSFLILFCSTFLFCFTFLSPFVFNVQPQIIRINCFQLPFLIILIKISAFSTQILDQRLDAQGCETPRWIQKRRVFSWISEKICSFVTHAAAILMSNLEQNRG